MSAAPWRDRSPRERAVLGAVGAMVALAVNSKEMVHKVYDKAIALGAKDEGAAGPRGE